MTGCSFARLTGVPVIETERLILRAPVLADMASVVAFLGSERARFVGGPHGPDVARLRFAAGVGGWALRGFGWWVIEERATGAVAGRTGLSVFEGIDGPELGWHLHEGFEGKGIAHEAALAARAHAARAWGIARPVSCIDRDNTRSRHLAERLGAAYEAEGTVMGHPCQIWRHPEAAA